MHAQPRTFLVAVAIGIAIASPVVNGALRPPTQSTPSAFPGNREIASLAQAVPADLHGACRIQRSGRHIDCM